MKTKVSIVHSPKPCEASVTGCDWGTNTVNPFSMPLWKVLSQFISNGLDLLSLHICRLGIRTTDCLSHYISPFYVFRLRIRVYCNELGEMWYSDPRKKIFHLLGWALATVPLQTLEQRAPHCVFNYSSVRHSGLLFHSLSECSEVLCIQGFLLLGHDPNLRNQPHPLGQILEILGTQRHLRWFLFPQFILASTGLSCSPMS